MLAQAWSTRGDRAALLVTEEQRQQQVRGDVTATQEVLETGRPVPAGTGWIQSAGVGSGQRRRWTELGRVAQPSMAYCRWCTERDVRERGKLRLQSNLSLYGRRGLFEPNVSVKNHLISTGEPSRNASFTSLMVYHSPVSQHSLPFSYPTSMLYHSNSKFSLQALMLLSNQCFVSNALS
ncbi:hypothetical protein VPH35_072453 [Triticum aestivum]